MSTQVASLRRVTGLYPLCHLVLSRVLSRKYSRIFKSMLSKVLLTMSRFRSFRSAFLAVIHVFPAAAVFLPVLGLCAQIVTPANTGSVVCLGEVSLSDPVFVAVGGAGNLYSVDSPNFTSRISNVRAGGRTSGVVDMDDDISSADGPGGMVVNGAGTLFVAGYYKRDTVQIPCSRSGGECLLLPQVLNSPIFCLRLDSQSKSIRRKWRVPG